MRCYPRVGEGPHLRASRRAPRRRDRGRDDAGDESRRHTDAGRAAVAALAVAVVALLARLWIPLRTSARRTRRRRHLGRVGLIGVGNEGASCRRDPLPRRDRCRGRDDGGESGGRSTYRHSLRRTRPTVRVGAGKLGGREATARREEHADVVRGRCVAVRSPSDSWRWLAHVRGAVHAAPGFGGASNGIGGGELVGGVERRDLPPSRRR